MAARLDTGCWCAPRHLAAPMQISDALDGWGIMTNEQRLAILEMAMEVWREDKSRDPVDMAARMAEFIGRDVKTHHYEPSAQPVWPVSDFIRKYQGGPMPQTSDGTGQKYDDGRGSSSCDAMSQARSCAMAAAKIVGQS